MVKRRYETPKIEYEQYFGLVLSVSREIPSGWFDDLEGNTDY